ncbi:hypothetical protein [Novosphingobium soli]|uniref:DUF2946 domain-containing protein n=1 Tax=Novosphingobium soli TaxID=574956 RepID=A0ABV6CTF2_9SPHN
MLRRLLLFLLVVGLALPTLAMPGHCAPAPTHHGAHAHGDHQGPSKPLKSASSARECIGCGTLPLIQRPHVGALASPSLPHDLTNDDFGMAAALPPATPPPRF